MIAWRILAETHSLTTTVAMIISRVHEPNAGRRTVAGFQKRHEPRVDLGPHLTDELRPDRAVRSTLIFVLICTAALTR